MKRILSLVLAMVMVLGSFSAVFAAEVTPAEEAGKLLKDLEILNGVDGEGNLGLEKDLRREDAILLLSRLMGEVEVANEFPVGDDFPFEDVKNPDYQGPIAWAYANKFTDGKSATKFGFNDPLTAQQYATFLLRALGYDVTGEGYTNALETAKELGLLADVEVENGTTVKRGVMAVMSVNALYTNSKDSTVTLGEKLGLELPVIVPEVPAELTAEVTADNLKSFTVVFNQAVESAKVAVKGNTVTLKLAEDKMSAVGYYGTVLAQSASVEYTINAETEAGLKLEDLKVTKVVTDTVVPALLGARALNAKQIELQFSEPVNLDHSYFSLLNDIKIGGNAVVAKATANHANNTVVLEISVALSEGTHTIEVAKVKDFANFVVPTLSLDINVVEDKNAPVATLAEVSTKDKVVVTFDESLKLIGEYKVNGTAATATFVADSNNTQVALTAFGGLGIGAIVEVRVEYKGQSDIMDNIVKDWATIKTNVADDATLPTVELTSVEAGNKVTLTFSKPMAAEGKFTVLDKDGKEHKAEATIPSFKADTNNTVLVFSGTELGLNSVEVGQYSIKLTEMKDATIRSNPLATATLAINALDTNKPVISADYLLTVGKDADGTTNNDKDTVTIYFSEAMDIATIENLSNYLILGSPLHVEANAVKAVAAADGRSVAITYKGITLIAAPTIKVLGVKDVAGNVAASVDVDEQTNTAITYVGPANLVDANTIEIKFSANVKDVYASFAVLYDAAGTNAVTGFQSATVDADDQTVVILKSPIALDQTKTYTLKLNDVKSISNVYGENLTGTYANNVLASSLVDQINPTATKIVEAKVNAGKLEILVDLSEELVAVTQLSPTNILVDVDGAMAVVEKAEFVPAVVNPATPNRLKITVNAAPVAGKLVKVLFYSNAAFADANTNLLKNFNFEIKSLFGSAAPALNTVALQAAKDAAATKVEADYTTESWAVLTTALAMPETTQVQIDAKATAITAAIAALAEVPVGPTVNATYTETETFPFSLGTVSIVLENVADAAKYEVVFGPDAAQKTAMVAIDAVTEAFPIPAGNKVTINVYDADDVLLETFVDVVLTVISL